MAQVVAVPDGVGMVGGVTAIARCLVAAVQVAMIVIVAATVVALAAAVVATMTATEAAAEETVAATTTAADSGSAVLRGRLVIPKAHPALAVTAALDVHRSAAGKA